MSHMYTHYHNTDCVPVTIQAMFTPTVYYIDQKSGFHKTIEQLFTISTVSMLSKGLLQNRLLKSVAKHQC